MAFFDKELLISAGLGGFVGIAVGASFLKSEEEGGTSKGTDLLWFVGIGAAVAGVATKIGTSKRAAEGRHAAGYFHHHPHPERFERPGWPSYEHDWENAGFPEHEQHWDTAGWPRYSAGHLVGAPGMSFEEAWSHAAQKYDPSRSHVPDLTAAELARPFSGGAFLNTCGVPEDMGVTIKAAVQNGHAIGVTVTTSPPSPHIAICVDSAVRRMQFPVNPNLDAVTQTF